MFINTLIYVHFTCNMYNAIKLKEGTTKGGKAMKQKIIDHIMDMYFDKMHMTALFIRDKNQFLKWNEKAAAHYEGIVSSIERHGTGCELLDLYYHTGSTPRNEPEYDPTHGGNCEMCCYGSAGECRLQCR